MQKFIVTGRARHGKDTVCALLRQPYQSSSEAFAPHAFAQLHQTHAYTTVQQCFEDRVRHRQAWFDMIRAYTHDNPARLAQDIFATCNVYCGLRSKVELDAILQAFPDCVVIWVDALARVGHTQDAIDITPADAHHILDNNGTHDDLRRRIQTLLFTP